MATKKVPVLVPDHVYVPKHEIMNKKDAQKVLDEFNCKPTELPLIFVTDPAILGLGVKPGDMIRITRKSGTAGESTYYRYVVET
ncbi:DNA-directed RNA polymerase subunit H [Candidatus Nitrosopelagicus sp.]|nr:DNA-directed RNA polymerase subunit H [Candidatus Nitrosopelagicus sp.]